MRCVYDKLLHRMVFPQARKPPKLRTLSASKVSAGLALRPVTGEFTAPTMCQDASNFETNVGTPRVDVARVTFAPGCRGDLGVRSLGVDQVLDDKYSWSLDG